MNPEVSKLPPLPESLEEAIRNVADWANSDGDYIGIETEHAIELLRGQVRAYALSALSADREGEADAAWLQRATDKWASGLLAIPPGDAERLRAIARKLAPGRGIRSLLRGS